MTAELEPLLGSQRLVNQFIDFCKISHASVPTQMHLCTAFESFTASFSLWKVCSIRIHVLQEKWENAY